MSYFFKTTEVFAYFFLFFATFTISANSQTRSVNDIDAGTKIVVSMDNEINSKVSSVNDTFTATLAEPLRIRETVALPVGTIIEGRITDVRRAAAAGVNGKMVVSFETLRLLDGTKLVIEGVLIREPQATGSRTKPKALTIVGATAVGGIVGAVSKISNGALFGAAIGAGAGTAIALLRKGENVRLKANEKLEIKLTKNVTLPAQDY